MKLYRLAIPVIVGLAVGGVIFILIVSRENKAAESHVSGKTSKVVSSATPTPAKLLTWTDPAGFTFQYPDGLIINKHEEDNVNYAHVEFTTKDHPGNLIVWAKDSSDTLTSWIKSDKRFTGASVIDTTFAGIGGKKILISSPSAMIVAGAIDQNILFTVETSLVDKDFWSKIHETIAGSFAFATDNSGSSGNSSSAGAGDQGVDEEETIQ